MIKKKVVIIGCGFAGIFASRYLSRRKDIVDVTVIDKKDTFDFLPLLPDLIGRGIKPRYLTYPLSRLAKALGFELIKDEVTSAGLGKNTITCVSRSVGYDYLLIASGSQTNFYAHQELKKTAYKLNGVEDIENLIAAIKNNDFANFIICGGGYTGVEIATNLKIRYPAKKVVILERAPEILGPLPEWIKQYTVNNLRLLGIEVFTNTVLESFDGRSAVLSGKRNFTQALVIWVAGVRAADFIQELACEKNPQGRVKVDEYLRLQENCFVAGDAALVAHKNNFLRMAVQFSIYQAIIAAKNILRSVKDRPLIKYQPLDIGMVIPMANNRSCGIIMGLRVKGRLATLMHFIMCIYRSFGWRNKLGIVKSLMTG